MVTLKIGTRASKLALIQSRWVKEKIEHRYPQVRVELVKITTKGDKILDSPLSKVGGKGLFVKEIEDALLRNQVDLAVHSVKDIPADLPEGLCLSAFPEREDPRDAFISSSYPALNELPAGARIGTSSLRRAAQLLHLRPDLTVLSLRGNVDTRLRKLDAGEYDAIILAVAGLKRFGLEKRIRQFLDVKQMLPVVGQGALGIQTRKNDDNTLKIIKFLDHKPTQAVIRAERAFLKKLEGGCQVPIAALAEWVGDKIYLQGLVAELDGSRIIKHSIEGEGHQAGDIGIALASNMLLAGADKILADMYRQDSENSKNIY